MDHIQLRNALANLEQAVIARGFVSPDIYASINWSEFAPYRITFNYQVPGGVWHYENFQGDDLLTCLAEAQRYAEGLARPEEAARKDWIASLGRLLDDGRRLDMPVEFINPLEAAMRQLSENIIEDQS